MDIISFILGAGTLFIGIVCGAMMMKRKDSSKLFGSEPKIEQDEVD